MKIKKYLVTLLICLILIESLFIGGDLSSRRLEQGGILHSVYSTLDLILLFFFVVVILISASLLIDRRLNSIVEKKLDLLLSDQKWLIGIVVILSLLMYESFQDFLFIRAEMAPIHYQGYRQLLSNYISLLGWIFLIGLQILGLISLIKIDVFSSWITNLFRKRWFYAFLGLAVFVFALDQSNFGAFPGMKQIRGFTELPTPLLGLQVIAIVIIVSLYTRLISYLEKEISWFSKINIDYIMMVSLALLAFVIWSKVPIGPSSFIDTPRPPNFEFYPISDALNYEISAQRLLIGNGLGRDDHIGYRVYLAFLHFIAGDGLTDILPLHLILLSITPMLLYTITRSINDRLSGLFVSVLFILRERNALLLAEHITITNSKASMTEPLTVFGVVLLVALLVRWLRKPEKQLILPLLAGGVLGWVILLRVETMALFPVIGLGLLFYFWKYRRHWFRGMILITIGIILVVGPWFYHTVSSQGSLLALGMGRESYIISQIQDYNEEGNLDQQSERLGIFQLFPHHLANNLKQLFYYLPSNHQPLLTINSLLDTLLNRIDISDMEGDRFSEKYLERYVRSLPYWWNDWDGHLVKRSFIPILGTVFLIAAGFSQLEGKQKRLVMILIFAVLVHISIYSFVGFSGGRFIQIIDWIPLMLYAIGLSWFLNSALTQIGVFTFSEWWVIKSVNPEDDEAVSKKMNSAIIFVGAILLFLGFSFPLTENLIPSKYTEDILTEKLLQVSTQNNNKNENIEYLLKNEPDLHIIYGKALYPRLFEAGSRMEDDRYGDIPDFSSKRVEFFLVGTDNIWVTLPMNKKIEYFAHGSEVIVLGIREPEIFNKEGQAISSSYIKGECFILITEKQTNEPMILNCLGESGDY